MRSIRFEQAVYGSFPFWDRGYAFLATSPGCRAEWLADLRAACQNYGERPAGAAEAGGLFALRLKSGLWAVVRPSPQGCDDQGRPGALAFHALLLSGRDYRKAGADPFALADALRSDWTAETRNLSPGTWRPGPSSPPTSAPDGRVGRIVSLLESGRRVALEADGPIDDLAPLVWRALPVKVRAHISVATWAFGNGNRFDLLALPSLKGVALDPTYVDPDAPEIPSPRRWRLFSK